MKQFHQKGITVHLLNYECQYIVGTEVLFRQVYEFPFKEKIRSSAEIKGPEET